MPAPETPFGARAVLRLAAKPGVAPEKKARPQNCAFGKKKVCVVTTTTCKRPLHFLGFCFFFCVGHARLRVTCTQFHFLFFWHSRPAQVQNKKMSRSSSRSDSRITTAAVDVVVSPKTQREVAAAESLKYYQKTAALTLVPVGIVGLWLSEWSRRRFATAAAIEQEKEDQDEEGKPEDVPSSYANAVLIGADIVFVVVIVAGLYCAYQTVAAPKSSVAEEDLAVLSNQA